MKMKKWKPYLISAALALAVGGVSALLSRDGMAVYDQTAVKPALSPPMWLFPVAWSILYILMGVGAARVWQTTPAQGRSKAINLYIGQLVVNFFWSLLFFNAQAYGFAVLWLIVLLVLVVWMTLSFLQIDAIAGKLQIPYILWLCFALYLNVAVWILN